MSGPAPLALYLFSKVLIVECAYSNLFYDYDFWRDYTGLSKVKKILIDKRRTFLMKSAGMVIFQSDVLKQRAIQKGWNPEKLKVVKPAYYLEDVVNYVARKKHIALFIVRNQRHKNIEAFCDFVVTSKEDWEVHTTLNIDDDYYQDLVSKYPQLIIKPLGRLNQIQLKEAIRRSSCLVNVSYIESFSNVFMEAWVNERLLVTHSRDWSIWAAKNAAFYIDKESISKLEKVLKSQQLYSAYVIRGKERLDFYGTYDKKMSNYIETINA